jgi:HD-like signal output (HDOD) protein
MRRPDELVKSAIKLASLPSIYLRLNEVTNDARSTSTDVARVIQEDTSLSARLLRLVNSAFYGFPSRVDTITQAINLVGTNQVLELALASSVLRAFDGIPKERVDMDSFWRHSIGTAIASRTLALRRRVPNAERLFVAGLLHDVGRLVLFLEEPDAMAGALEAAVRDEQLLVEAERAAFGFDHADVGRALLAAWKLPTALQEAVGRHHAPSRVGDGSLDAATVHVADVIANALELGFSGERLVPAFDAAAWDALRIEPAELPLVAVDVERQYADIVQIMLVYEHWAEDALASASS